MSQDDVRYQSDQNAPPDTYVAPVTWHLTPDTW